MSRLILRADQRAMRRFRAMLAAHDLHGREARLYTEAEHLFDRLMLSRKADGR